MVQVNQHYLALLGSLGADEGSLTRPSVWTVAHMAQEVKALDMPAIDFCPFW